MTPGLANKICIPAAKKVCCNFPETLNYLPKDKAVLSGSPIREELLTGDRLSGLQYAGLSANRPVILVIGGSLGSVTVNHAVRSILPKLLSQFQVIHICGKGNLDESLIGTSGYVQYEYVDKPLRHLFAAADLIISRAGANSICEILALRKPNILIPLSAAASRGDQILNANSFAKQGFKHRSGGRGSHLRHSVSGCLRHLQKAYGLYRGNGKKHVKQRSRNDYEPDPGVCKIITPARLFLLKL